MTDEMPDSGLPSDADTTVPHSARIWNYWLGGRLNYPAGSYLALQDGTSTGTEAFDEAQDEYDDTGALPYHLRRPERVAAFFDGLDLVEPGVVPLPQWRPDPGQPGSADVPNVGGVGRKA